MNNSEPKKHHYVPKCILKNFGVGKKCRLYVLDKTVSNVFSSNVLDSGHENHFYKDDNFGYGSTTEQKLDNLENKCAPIFDKIVSEESIRGIGNNEQSMVCLFVAVQLTRTNKTRESLSDINKAISKRIREFGKDPNRDIENFKELSESEIKSSSIHVLNTMPSDLAENLLDKEIGLLKSPNGEYFYTSDHPISRYNYFPKPGRGNLGLQLKGIEVHFPISPKLCLTFTCSQMLSEIRKKVNEHNIRISRGAGFPVDMLEEEKMITDIDNRVTRELKPENVEFQNSLQVIQSSRFVYSNNRGFELAKDMLKTNPELSEPEGLSTN